MAPAHCLINYNNTIHTDRCKLQDVKNITPACFQCVVNELHVECDFLLLVALLTVHTIVCAINSSVPAQCLLTTASNSLLAVN